MNAMYQARKRFVDNNEILVSGTGYIPLETGDIWRRRRERSVARRMHAWFFYYFLRPFNDRNDEIIAEKLIKLATAWRAIVELPPTRIPMAYHDEATAQRAIAMSCFLQDYKGILSEDDAAVIRQILSESAELLSDNEFYSGGTNHGMYQDFSLIVLSPHIVEGNKYYELAVKRLNEYFENAFTSDNIHKEQSPQYHFIVANHLRHYADALAEQDPAAGNFMRDIFERTERFSILSISPLGKFPPVSDTSSELVSTLGYSRVYDTPEFQYAVTQGLLGKVPDFSQIIAEETGVAIFREDWADNNSIYLYFSSAYNSDYHKHSDELSLYLVYKGLEIFREAGPNGYEMKDPFTEYAYSSFAHNTLIVNGEGLPRTDSQTMGQVGISNIGRDGASDFSVLGWNNRFPGVEHSRRVTFSGSGDEESSGTLEVVDAITADDQNEYQLLWHFGPYVRPEIRDKQVVISGPSGAKVAEIEINANVDVQFLLVEGQTEPDIQGWFFPEMGVKKSSHVLSISFRGDVELTLDVSFF